MRETTDLLHSCALAGLNELREKDPNLYRLIENEHRRQLESLSLIASCGGTDLSVMAAESTSVINVTAEGYPGNRYHSGCKYIDQIESLAIERAKQVFKAQYANVQPHCASSANQIVMHALLKPGDPILGMALDAGGHLTHGAKVNISGRTFNAVHYGADEKGTIDFNQVRELAHRYQPRLIICGTTSYSRTIPFEKFREIADEIGAYLLADITHIAGLVAADLHPSSIHHAHFTTLCTFKQLFGPRGGLILMGRDHDTLGPDGKRTLSQSIQSAVFPLIQGSPAVHTIAAKARAFSRLMEPEFKVLATQIMVNAKTLAHTLIAKGYSVVSNGTDNHIVLFKLPEPLTGYLVEHALEQCNIIVNKNKVPLDTRNATLTTGIRLGANSVALRKMGSPEMKQIAELMDRVIKAIHYRSDTEYDLDARIEYEVEHSVKELCHRFPLPYACPKDEETPLNFIRAN